LTNLYGKSKKISSELPVPVVKITKETETLGGVANIANNIISEGSKAFIIKTLNSSYVLITRVKKGMALVQTEKHSARAKEIYDVSGFDKCCGWCEIYSRYS
jgi:bifunctional ADP-heptose synthase (sugar kinase/adenylyltransferase)